MPSIIPSYIYTLFASIIVGALIVCTCGLSTLNMKHEAEEQQLSNVAEYVATKSLELVSCVATDNLTSTLCLNIPSLIGNQRYWIQIASDSSKTWVEVGFGTTAMSSRQRAYMPSVFSASGTFTSGSGVAILECYSTTSGVHLTLTGGS